MRQSYSNKPRKHGVFHKHPGLSLLGIGALLLPLIALTDNTPALASEPTLITVTGGEVTDHLGYRYHAFTHGGGLAGVTPGPDASTTDELIVAGGDVTVDYLVVAGGGGAGRNQAAGGGAGGVIGETGQTVSVGTHTVVVGGGGKGGSGPPEWRDPEASSGCKGAASSFLNQEAIGGGGGGATSSSPSTRTWLDCDGNPTTEASARDGGAGGSGGGGARGGQGLGGSGEVGQGKNGGNSGTQGGGGGGAGLAGGTDGNGGDGVDDFSAFGRATGAGELISGVAWFGGGGGAWSGGKGGKGGGRDSRGVGSEAVAAKDFSALDGLPKTGGGGAGCANAAPGCRGGHGGSGVVIVRYAVPWFTDLVDPHTSEATISQTINAGGALPAIGLTGAEIVEVTSGELPPGISLGSYTSDPDQVTFSGQASTAGSYTFTLRAFKTDPTNGPTVFTDRDVTVTVKANQVLQVGSVSSQDRLTETVQLTGQSVVAGSETPTGLSITWASTTTGVCTIDSSGLVSLLARGTCTITADQAGGQGDGFEVNPATQVSRTFSVADTALDSLTLSTGTLQPQFSASQNAYQVSVPNSVTSLTLTPTSRFAGASIDVSEESVTSGSETTPIGLAVGANPITVTVSDGDAENTITVTITRAAPPTPPASTRPPRGEEPPAITPVTPGTLVIPRPTTTSPVLGPQTPPVAAGPVITNNQPPRPTDQTTATIGGVPTPVLKAPLGNTGVRITAGRVDVGVRVGTPQQGSVSTTPQGTPELTVQKGQPTLISGTGVAPGSTVQAFLPLNGLNAIELGRIQADATGTFNGEAVLNTPLSQAPLPVGRQVLQILGVDEDGNQTVVNMTINIAQPPPQPEINREDQSVPTLGVGQSLATEAGVPVAVSVIPVPENNQTLIEGDGWTMGISVAGDGSNVEETDTGEVVLQLVRDETATVSGSGFMPLTRADVWLFSDPTLLGTVDIDENGEFNGVVNVDGSVVAVGEHTLQLQGVGEDGYVRAANLGVVVGESADAPAPEPTATTSLNWLLWTLIGLGVLAVASGLWWFRRRGLTGA